MTVTVCYWDDQAKVQRERDATPQEIADIEARQIGDDKVAEIIAKNVADLWTAADSYIYKHINGAAYAMLTLGVMQNKPKAKAVAAWIDSIWAEYWIRKARALVGDSVSFDFGSFGLIPYSVPELREEVSDIWES